MQYNGRFSDWIKPISYLAATGVAVLVLSGDAEAQQRKPSLTEYLNKMRTQITMVDKTIQVGRNGQQRNVTHDMEAYKRNIERELYEMRARAQSRPCPATPLIQIKVYPRKQ
jgi:hypothetical protein